jgi:hypothetical protein
VHKIPPAAALVQNSSSRRGRPVCFVRLKVILVMQPRQLAKSTARSPFARQVCPFVLSFFDLLGQFDGQYWTCPLAFVTGLVNQELLLRNGYQVAEGCAGFPAPCSRTFSQAQGEHSATISVTIARNATIPRDFEFSVPQREIPFSNQLSPAGSRGAVGSPSQMQPSHMKIQ